jgi:hypothetical protein
MIDDGVSIVDTWKGWYMDHSTSYQSMAHMSALSYYSYDEASQEQGAISWSVEFHCPACKSSLTPRLWMSTLTLISCQLDTIIKATGVAPAALQIERHPLLRQDDLIAYCKDKNIHITAYSVCSLSHPETIS